MPFPKHHLSRHLYTAGRILLGGLFIYASWDKVLQPAVFAEIILNYQILPKGPTRPLGRIW